MLTEPSTVRPIDTLGAGTILDDTTSLPADQDAAAAYINRHCDDANTIRAMLGIGHTP